MRLRTLATPAVLACGVAALAAGCGGSGGGDRTIVASGNGAVKAVPDVAQVGFGVTVTAPAAAAARTAADRRIAAVIAVLRAKGIARADVQTDQISLSPTFGRDGSRVTGYTATSSVSVTIRKLGTAGEVIPAAVAAGANQTNGPSLTVSPERQKALYQRALKEAVADAGAHADAIAAASGAQVGEIRNVVEGSASTPVPIEAKAADAVATPVEAGTVEVDAQVTVTYVLD